MSEKPSLSIVIDSEEAFDWKAPFSRDHTCVDHFARIDRLQAVFDKHRLVATYVCDYPVVTQAIAVQPLRAFAGEGRADLGAHLHPWVTPPFEETVCDFNSFMGNLPLELERRKIETVLCAHETSFGAPAEVFLAGRYGLGPNSLALLNTLGLKIDLSLCPPMDFRPDFGPDYSALSSEPFWAFAPGELLCLPITGGKMGLLAKTGMAQSLSAAARSAIGEKMRAPGLLARLGLLDQMRLTPEGHSLEDMIRLTQALYGQGVRAFVMNLHSPSIEPGNTPYVRSEAELTRFLERIDLYLDWFASAFGGDFLTPMQWRNAHLSDDRLQARRGELPAIGWAEPGAADLAAQ
ncbi:MAG: hypothetical protein MRY63_03125 [Neomegalonema sp.]|nr:hypothetical protein [Neomegalonema sp.]